MITLATYDWMLVSNPYTIILSTFANGYLTWFEADWSHSSGRLKRWMNKEIVFKQYEVVKCRLRPLKTSHPS